MTRSHSGLPGGDTGTGESSVPTGTVYLHTRVLVWVPVSGVCKGTLEPEVGGRAGTPSLEPRVVTQKVVVQYKFSGLSVRKTVLEGPFYVHTV